MLSTLPGKPKTLGADDREISTWLGEVGGATTRKVAEHFGISLRNARLKLAVLVARGIIAEIGSSPTDPKRRYVVAEKSRTGKR